MRKGERRRWQLLLVSLNEFIDKGFYGTSSREIVDTAGVSSGLLFHYFESKEKIYEELVRIAIEEMPIDKTAAKASPKEYFEDMLKRIFEQFEKSVVFTKMFIFIGEARHTTIDNSTIKELLDKNDFYKQWTTIIRAGQRSGVFRAGNARTLCVTFFGALQGIAREKVQMPDTPLPDPKWLMNILCKPEQGK